MHSTLRPLDQLSSAKTKILQSANTSVQKSWSTTSTTVAQKRKQSQAEKDSSPKTQNLFLSSPPIRKRSLALQSSFRVRSYQASSASTADPPPLKPLSSVKRERFSARLISSPPEIRFKTRSKCSRSCVNRSKAKAPLLTCSVSAPPATRKTSS